MESDSNSFIFVVVLILLSAYFSATETAFSSISKTRLKNMADHGNEKASRVLALTDKYDRLLSTILVGNNIVNIAVASIMAVWFVSRFGSKGTSIATIVTTVVVLIFGEVTPKSLAKESPEKVAMWSAPFLGVLMVLFTPVNLFFYFWKHMLSKVFKIKDDRRLTENDLIALVEEAELEGGINDDESELIRSAIEFNDRDVSDIATPRVDIEGFKIDTPNDKISKIFLETGLSRLPVYEETPDKIVGILHYKDFGQKVLLAGRSVKDVMQRPVFVSEGMKVGALLKLLQKSKSHMAVVIDEYGGTFGVVTMEDVLEELVGEIWDEHDEVIDEFVKIGKKKYRIVCSADIEDFYEKFSITGESDSATVSGWVIEQLGRIPKEGDSFDFENLHVTVTDTDYQRVLEIVVEVKDEEEKQPEEHKETTAS